VIAWSPGAFGFQIMKGFHDCEEKRSVGSSIHGGCLELAEQTFRRGRPEYATRESDGEDVVAGD